MTSLSAPYFYDEAEAFKFLEGILWPTERPCPHCRTAGRSAALRGKSCRPGLYKCYACRKPFTVRVGTIFESSHIKLHLWLQAIFLLSSSKKGMSSNQLSRMLGLSLKTAWFMAHRIREAMKTTFVFKLSGIVEADETYFGKKAKENIPTQTTRGQPFRKGGRGGGNHKMAIMSLVERGGTVRSFHAQRPNQRTAHAMVRQFVEPGATLYTDSSKLYTGLRDHANVHETVNHSGWEYVRGNVHTNTIEGFFSIFKRGMKGVYQTCSEKHLHRYLAEFDFRYNNRQRLGVSDYDRTIKVIKGTQGRRLPASALSRSGPGYYRGPADIRTERGKDANAHLEKLVGDWAEILEHWA